MTDPFRNHGIHSKDPDEISTFIGQIYSGNQFLPHRALKRDVSIVGQTWNRIGFYEFDSQLPFSFVTEEIRSSYLFLSCTGGNATRSSNKRTTECASDDVVPTSSMGVAKCVSGNQGFSHLSLVVDADELNGFLAQWVGKPLSTPVQFELRPLLPEVASEWNVAASCLRLMASMNSTPDIAAHALLEHMFKLLATRHPNNHSALLTSERYAQERTARTAIELIRQDPIRWKTLSAIAHWLACPASELENGILRLSGKKSAELFYEARLDCVKRTLGTDGNHRFIATLRKYGFSLSDRFVRAYRKRFGELPSTTYRRNPNAIDVIQSSHAIRDTLSERTIGEFVDASLGKTITLADLAQLVEMSEHATITAFKEQFSCTPMQYVIARRLERAKSLLQNTSVSILSIALECGFGSQSYLTTLIKRHYGVTPRQLRLSGRTPHTRADSVTT